ncbi:rRNA methyltransferase 3, mitochondrial [Aricia agestis]|uniref:rRNA methyltransferase 3, mitochondrial n=1 Tax=Aricia agestis TaxID=91739 RepID=UPI001C206400|nr:rRNA methyltransferase 3, mitochondrial [Aricia agestis]
MSTNILTILCKGIVTRVSNANSIRCYSRWTHRKPSKVVLPFEAAPKTNLKTEKVIDLSSVVEEKKEKAQQKQRVSMPNVDKEIADAKLKQENKNQQEKFKDIKESRESQLKKRKFYLSQKKVFNDDGEIIYEKLKDNDGRINYLLVKLKSKKERLHTRQMLVEGWRLIVDGLKAKCKLNYVIFSDVEDLNRLRPFLPKTGVLFYKIPYKEIGLWSDVETSPGLFGVFEMPTSENIARTSRPLPLHLVCDNIRTPGNLGAILRAAVAVGCDKILLTKGCVDLWDSKVIRSAAGAHFRQPIQPSVEWEDIETLLPHDTSVFIADSNTNVLDEENSIQSSVPVVPYYGVEFANLKHVTLIVGGETEGISVESYRFAAAKNGVRLNIPLQQGVDSLNTGMATAVISCEIRKQMTQAWAKLKLQKQDVQAT